jgi:predicted site-specific integrase-resolvase
MPDQDDPLVVHPKRACALLNCSRATLYERMNRGDIESFVDGGGRWVSVSSIKSYVESKLAAAASARAREASEKS